MGVRVCAPLEILFGS